MPGDSHQTITDEKYRAAFLSAITFAEDKAYEDKEHFPVFMMGNSMQTYVRAKSKNKGTLSEMKDLKHTNSRV